MKNAIQLVKLQTNQQKTNHMFIEKNKIRLNQASYFTYCSKSELEP